MATRSERSTAGRERVMRGTGSCGGETNARRLGCSRWRAGEASLASEQWPAGEHDVAPGLRSSARSLLGAGHATAQAAKPRTPIARALGKLYARGAIDPVTYAADRAIHARRQAHDQAAGRRAPRRARGRAGHGRGDRRARVAARRAPVPAVPDARSATANGGRRSRCSPAGQRVKFDGSELIWQYVPGQGLQFHPLANFGVLNAYAKSASASGSRTRCCSTS